MEQELEVLPEVQREIDRGDLDPVEFVELTQTDLFTAKCCDVYRVDSVDL